MKLSSILGAIGTGAAVFKATSNVLLVAGVLYLADCRVSTRFAESSRLECWTTGLSVSGLGAAGRGGFSLGFNTLNPALRREDEQGVERDEHGRFVRRKG